MLASVVREMFCMYLRVADTHAWMQLISRGPTKESKACASEHDDCQRQMNSNPQLVVYAQLPQPWQSLE